MKSGKLLATNDVFIEELINDDDYQITEDGRVFTLIESTGKRSTKNNWRETSYKKSKAGYVAINYKYKRLSLHRIIYRKFLGKLKKELVINHKDGNPGNNIPSNLELVTQSENQTHRFQVLKKAAVYGNVKLSFEIADVIRQRKNDGKTYKQISLEFGISKGHISEIINNQIWVRS